MTGAGGGLPVDPYDLVIFDLDGVVYLVDEPIPSAVDVIGRLRSQGKPVAFVTNNASRRPEEVAELLRGMGVSVHADEVLTAGTAAAAELAGRFPPGSPVLVVGADALRAEVRAVGLSPVGQADEQPVAVVQGYGPRVGWSDLAEAALAVRAGAWWVATNADPTLPTPRGPVPGNGALVAALRVALDREPDLVVGKPGPGLFASAAGRTGAIRPLVIGDRLDTDIEGAGRAGMDSLLVLTGVSGVSELLVASPSSRPTFVVADLTGLFESARLARMPLDAVGAFGPDEGWRVADDGFDLLLTGSGSSLAALRLLCATSWSGRQQTGTVTPGSAAARVALADLRL